MASIVEFPEKGPAIKLKGFYDRVAAMSMKNELAAVVVYSNDIKGRGRTCLLPVNESVPLVEIKTRINELATKLQTDKEAELRNKRVKQQKKQ